jgi:Ca-activated chloride channel homolog
MVTEKMRVSASSVISSAADTALIPTTVARSTADVLAREFTSASLQEHHLHTTSPVNSDAAVRREARWSVKSVLLVVLSLLGTAGVFAQGAISTFKGGVDLVALNVVVVDRQQRFVGGLTADNFTVYEDGIPQDLSYFAAGDVPLDLAILLDTSASMMYRLATAQRAAIGFASALRPIDRLLVVDIKGSANVIAPLSHDLESAKQAIRSTFARGTTALYNGVYLTLKELAKQRKVAGDMRRQALVVLSDGDDTSSLVAFEDVMELAKQSGISVYTIMLKPKDVLPAYASVREGHAQQSEYAMKALAQETGGRSFFPREANELADVYGAIGQELASQYALGYTSNNPRRDGGYRRVVVRIVDREGVQPRTRAGYLAPRG